MNDWIVIGSYQSEIEALLAKGALEAAGIKCKTNFVPDLNARPGELWRKKGVTALLIIKTGAEKAKATLK